MKSVLRVLSATLLLVSALGSRVHATETSPQQPSWFPKVSCREAWNGAEIDRYDFDKDSHRKAGFGNIGYASYKKRIGQLSKIKRSDCYKDWAVLVYMAADNDLTPYAFWDLHEMEAAFDKGGLAGSSLTSDLVAEVDTAADSIVRRLHMFQAPVELQTQLKKEDFAKWNFDRIHSPISSIFSEKQAAKTHERRLLEFLNWGMRNYPAQHYFVVVWGHGQGWASDRGQALNKDTPFKNRFGGIAFDNSSNDFLSIPKLARVLETAQTKILEGRKKIDLYASDACLMQMVEVAYEISSSTRFIVGSSQTQSYLGLPYREMMALINSGDYLHQGGLIETDDEAYLLAKSLPRLVEKEIDPSSGRQGKADPKSAETFTISALNADELEAGLIPNLNVLGRLLTAYLSENRMRAVDLQFMLSVAPSFMGGSRELGSFLGLLAMHLRQELETLDWGPSRVARDLYQAVLETRETLDAVSMGYASGEYYRRTSQRLHALGFRAVGIWLPQTPLEYDTRISDFNESKFYRGKVNAQGVSTAAGWPGWFKVLYGRP